GGSRGLVMVYRSGGDQDPEKINESHGRCFYLLTVYCIGAGKGSPYDFGGEAIQIILKRMEDMRGKFGVIVAGYTHNMRRFID
ncbi:MAG: hypothetical protein IPP25_10040, partial [Saprospiraceae bacterium]|nr:hypothetical protein [Candidatus Opimibacter skivensis]